MTIWKKCFHVSPKHLIAHLSSNSILYVTSNLDAVDFFHSCHFCLHWFHSRCGCWTSSVLNSYCSYNNSAVSL